MFSLNDKQKIFEHLMVPMLEHYWNLVFQRKKLTKERFFWDTIRPLTDKENKEVYFVCPIPPIRTYWEVIMAMWLLFGEENLSMEDLVKSHMELFKKYEASLSKKLKNFELDQARFLIDIKDGKWKSNIFMDDPEKAYVELKLWSTLGLAENQKIREDFSNKFSKEFKSEIKKIL